MQGTALVRPQHNRTTGETMCQTNPTAIFLSDSSPPTISTRMKFAPFPL